MPACGSRWSGWLVMAAVLAAAACARQPEGERREAAGTDFTSAAAPAADTAAPKDAAPTPTPTPAAAAAPAPALPADLRERFQALVPASCRIDTAHAQGEVVKLTGTADSNASIAAAMRAIEKAAADAEGAGRVSGTDLSLIERGTDGRYRFEMSVRSARLAAR